MFSPFLSWMAWIMALRILEFFANRLFCFGFRSASIDNCSNNQNILLMNGRRIFALPKSNKILPDPAMNSDRKSPPDHHFNELDSVDSTNNYAMRTIHDGTARDGETWFAHHQFAGRGQRGRVW